MKILIATPDFPLWDGGIATVAYEVAKGLHGIGHNVTVLTPLQTSSDKGFDSALPFKVFRIKNIKDHYLKVYYHAFKMNQLVKRHKFDLIMAQSWYPSGIAAVISAKRHKINTTVTVHGNEALNPRFASRFWQRKMKKVFDETDKVFCVSNFTAKKLKEALSHLCTIDDKTSITYNGVDFNYFSPAKTDKELIKKIKPGGAKVILTLGRLVERKGHDMVIRALPEIKKEIPEVKYVVCGKGNYEMELKKLVKELNLSDDVIFTGFIPNKERVGYYNLCDLFIMPSREIAGRGDVEGFGITFLEANACEKPVIGGNSGGVSEAISDGDTGLIVNPSDYREIAEKCILLLSDRDLSKKLGRNGRKRIIQSFNWENTCKEIDKYLQSIKKR